jgi:hypothetical protein
MKAISRHFLIGLVLLVACPARAIIGDVDYQFSPGFNAFENPLLNTNNRLSTLFPSVPNGTMITLWNSGLQTFGSTSTYNTGTGWSLNFSLNPGTGAFLDLPTTSPFTNTFVGTELNHDGTPLPGGGFPSPFSGPSGLYLLGDKSPIQSTGNDIFLNVLGSLPQPGDQVFLWNTATQLYDASTYRADGTWDVVPTLNVGEAAFFNLVPEPSTAVLGLLGLALVCSRKR